MKKWLLMHMNMIYLFHIQLQVYIPWGWWIWEKPLESWPVVGVGPLKQLTRPVWLFSEKVAAMQQQYWDLTLETAIRFRNEAVLEVALFSLLWQAILWDWKSWISSQQPGSRASNLYLNTAFPQFGASLDCVVSSDCGDTGCFKSYE